MIAGYIAALGFGVILFLTLRDIRIFHRTRILSYRRGALRGLLASTVALLGLMLASNPMLNPNIGLLLTFIAVMLNKKEEAREDVFIHGESTLERLLGAVHCRAPEERGG